ncbi:C4-dicarboxylate ABC transporter [Corynebacterium poyangense]|uniref:C4-dicarboxylate ABC transporter n=1 Tax=Corynebacterium poyangense TaxID=2684405 RepID=A0A7H0SQU4_9CORY|nr:SLC13 family permease [Corynebacterium poyangense]QNQ90919.1 C4-dicarboxylate ABC transporter [Corynebacterium poyangense]
MAVASLCVLAIVVAIGFIKKVNIGFLALGAAVLLGMIGGMAPKEIVAGFDRSLFVTLVGVTFLFGMASINGTLELLSKKIVALVGRHTFLIPILMFVLSAAISAAGPGHIAAGILMTTFAIYLALEMNINPFSTALFAKLGANAGCASPISLTGVLAASLSEPLGYSDFGLHLFLTTLLSGFVFTLVVYFLYKAYNVKAENPMKLSELPRFNRKQLFTLLVMAVLVVLCIGFQMDVGTISFVGAALLVITKCVDEKKGIQNIPWGTLMMITGVGVLVHVMDTLGGISMISSFLESLMNQSTAVPIIAATSGILSWVSSTTGVVMPTLFPVAADITANTGVDYVELISAITATSFAAAISPLSTGGAIILSAYTSAKGLTIQQQNTMFKNLFLLSVANVVINIIMAALGVFSLGGII